MLVVHKEIFKDEKCIETRTKCSFPNCNDTFLKKIDLTNHVKDFHKVDIIVEENTFQSQSDFELWKENEEMRNYVYFSKQRGDVTGKHFRHVYYNCQHDGELRIHNREQTNKTNRKVHYGHVKSNAYCPARMTLKIRLSDGFVELVYIKSHSHPITIENSKFQPTPKSVKKKISAKLALGVPVKNVWKDLKRGKPTESDQRENENLPASEEHFIKKNVISNMKRKISHQRKLTSDVSISRREKGLDIPDDHVATVIDAKQWQVQSQTKDIVYVVNRIKERCPECSHTSNEDFLICKHLYNCNCGNLEICKHIFKIHSVSTIALYRATELEEETQLFSQLVEKLSDLVQNSEVVQKLLLPQINHKLTNMIKQAESISTKD